MAGKSRFDGGDQASKQSSITGGAVDGGVGGTPIHPSETVIGQALDAVRFGIEEGSMRVSHQHWQGFRGTCNLYLTLPRRLLARG